MTPASRSLGAAHGRRAAFPNAPVVRRRASCSRAVVIVADRLRRDQRLPHERTARGEARSALPHPWVTHNYSEGDHVRRVLAQIGNSIIIAAIATVLVVGVERARRLSARPLRSSAVARRSTRSSRFGLLFPIDRRGAAALPPAATARILDETLLGVALPEAAFGIPITVIILRPFMRAVPAELEDAAAMDGCTSFGFFWRILLPLSRPALMTVSILSVITSWNNFILPLLVLNDPNHWTLPLGVANYSTDHSTDTAGVLAFTTLSIVPALVFFLFAERRIVGGLSGAVKG